MDWRAAVDIYCERTGPEFWSEPLNAVSNLAFILAAILPFAAMRRAGERDGLLALLCGIAFCIGVGSFLFHTVAERWAALADTVPILLFIVTFLFAAMLRLFRLRGPVAAGATVGAFALSLVASPVAARIADSSLNGSVSYMPALALLGGSALALGLLRHPAARPVAVAAGVFAVSLTARTVDAGLCPHFPAGTHFAWHLLNGTMIGILLLTLQRYGKPRRRTTGG